MSAPAFLRFARYSPAPEIDTRETRRRDTVVIALALVAAVGVVVGCWRALGGKW